MDGCERVIPLRDSTPRWQSGELAALKEQALAFIGERLDTELAKLRPGDRLEMEWYFKRRRWSHAKWAEAVKDRDGWRCRICGDRYELHAHHIIPRSEDPTLADLVENGVTLCRKHHAAAHIVLGQPNVANIILHQGRGRAK